MKPTSLDTNPDATTSTDTTSTDTTPAPRVAVIMGSTSDYDTMKVALEILKNYNIETEARVVSAHRTPEWMFEYATSAQKRGIEVIIAGAGGAAHLPGMVASMTPLPVLGVPVKSSILNGVDSLLSIVQMPRGVPVGTLAIGLAGAHNAALLALRILALHDMDLQQRLVEQRDHVANEVRETTLPPLS